MFFLIFLVLFLIIKVADLVEDRPKEREKVVNYLRNIKEADDLDVIIALMPVTLFAMIQNGWSGIYVFLISIFYLI